MSVRIEKHHPFEWLAALVMVGLLLMALTLDDRRPGIPQTGRSEDIAAAFLTGHPADGAKQERRGGGP